MKTVIVYDFNVKLIEYGNQESRLPNNRQPLNPEATRIPVSLALLEKKHQVRFITEDTLEIMQSRRPRSLKSELTRVLARDLGFACKQQCLRTILTDMGIPRSKQSEILHEISSKACGIDTYNVFMMVDIDKVIYEEIASFNNEEEDFEAEGEPMEVEEQLPIPATKSSIDALERVVFDSSGSVSDCTVCMEEIAAGSEAIRMPCLHVYHSDCIVKWLQTSHLCPLCRYQILPQVNN